MEYLYIDQNARSPKETLEGSFDIQEQILGKCSSISSNLLVVVWVIVKKEANLLWVYIMSPLVGVWVIGIAIFFAYRIWKKRKLNKMVLESREKGLTRNWGVRVNRTPLDTKIGEVGDPGIHTATRGSIDEKGDA